MLVTVAVGMTIVIQKEAMCVPGHAMDQTVTGITTGTQFQSQASPCGTYDKQSSTGIGFHPGTLVSSMIVIPPMLHTHLFVHSSISDAIQS
jgi:hypothetical protein